MSDDHDHSHHEHAAPGISAPPEPTLPEDTGSQALSEALRSSFAIVKVLMVVLVIVFLGSGLFQVRSQEKAVRLHYGRPVGEGTNALLSAGLHWSWPYPIDEVVRIKFSEIQKVTSTVGWYFRDDAGGGPLNPAVDGYTITSDGNIIHTRATLSYRIVDPIRFEFDFLNASNAVQNALDNALIYASTRFTVDEILTRESTRFQETVQAKVTELVEKEKLGIVVERPPDMETSAPLALKGAFENVVKALSTKEKIRNDALGLTSQILNEASAEAARRTNTAEVERGRLVASVKADAANFIAYLPQYQANPALFANILLSEKIAQVLTNVQDKIYLPERADGKPRELRLQLSREPQKPAAQQTPPNQ
jgi:membrane protease subunit HflK